jgi:hypothetical protein
MEDFSFEAPPWGSLKIIPLSPPNEKPSRHQAGFLFSDRGEDLSERCRMRVISLVLKQQIEKIP